MTQDNQAHSTEPNLADGNTAHQEDVPGNPLNVTSGRGEVRSRRTRTNFDLGGKAATEKFAIGKLKKSSIEKAKRLDMPPTPRSCEWRATDDGWHLFRYWGEWNEQTGKKVKKDRYAGHLSREAWEVMKEYDYETFIALIA